jgi:hypothetical protein
VPVKCGARMRSHSAGTSLEAVRRCASA